MNESNQAFRYEVSCGTDVGRVRSLNEDALLDRSGIGLWAVADGMGGHDAGDFASRTIVDALDRVAPPTDGSGFLRDVEDRILGAHAALRQEADARGSGGIIGSTVVVLLVWNEHYACVWAGDSRLYLFRDGLLRQVSRDHSLVQDLVEAGELAPEQAESHPQANVVTRAVGAVEDLVLDKTHEKIRHGDMFLLCSDGLTRHVSDPEIAEVLANATTPGAAQALIDLALERGAKDNVTAVVVRCDPAGGASGEPGGGLGTRAEAERGPLPDPWDEDRETTMPVRAPLHAAPGAPGAGADAGLDPAAGALDPLTGSAPGAVPGAVPEDPLASILADGPADRRADADLTGATDGLGLDGGRDSLDWAAEPDPLSASDLRSGAGAPGPPVLGRAPVARFADLLARRGVRAGLLLFAAAAALAAAAYVLYSILTLP